MRRSDVPVEFRCQEDWEAMFGDDRFRHCAVCDRQVVDLSAGTRREAKRVLRSSTPCVRYRYDRKGRIQFQPSRVVRALKWCLALATSWAAPAFAEPPPVVKVTPTWVASAPYVGSLRIVVEEAFDGGTLPLDGAEVTLVGDDIDSPALYTDENGEVFVQGMSVGTYEVAISMPGFQSVRVVGLRVTKHRVAQLSVRMFEAEQEMGMVVVKRPTRDGGAHIITKSMLKKLF
ncbi:MAG: carboxypeptidase-like regulatory domain-containing protein [Myxococcota bacterium]